MTIRSKPKAMPPCGGVPYWRASEEPAEALLDARSSVDVDQLGTTS